MARPSFEQACAQYVHRFTLTHVPQWARVARPDGKYYAPQYRDCREWYENSSFPGERGHLGGRRHCFSTGATWPMGRELSMPI